MTTGLLLVQILNGLQFGILLFLVAAGLTLVFGVMDFINLAHGVQYMLGAYLAVLGEVDAVVFTAGIGEHDWWTRERVCSDLEPLGIGIDVTANRAADPGVISRRGTPVTVMVVPTDEERAIAEQTAGRLTDAARTTTPADTQG